MIVNGLCTPAEKHSAVSSAFRILSIAGPELEYRLPSANGSPHPTASNPREYSIAE